MKYTVVWQPFAERKLAELWNAGPDRVLRDGAAK
jgi:hypothetical protein